MAPAINLPPAALTRSCKVSGRQPHNLTFTETAANALPQLWQMSARNPKSLGDCPPQLAATTCDPAARRPNRLENSAVPTPLAESPPPPWGPAVGAMKFTSFSCTWKRSLRPLEARRSTCFRRLGP